MANGRLLPILNRVAKPLQDSGLRRCSLPTIGDVLCAIFYRKNESACTYAAAVKAVSNDAINFWQMNALPIVSEKRIQQITQKFLKKYNRLERVDKDRRTTPIYTKQFAEFKVKFI